MSSSSSLLELSLAAFTERVADTHAVPASGCVAALQGALGAALVSMAFQHAAGEGRSAGPDAMRGRADELRELSERLLQLVDEDARAYRAYLAGAGEARRKAARAALEVPLAVSETALAALRLAALGAPDVARALWCECSIGSSALEGALSAGLALVRANAAQAAAGDDPAWLGLRLERVPELEREGARLTRAVRDAESTKGGS